MRSVSLLTRCDRWDEAAESFRKAAELDGPKGICWSNLGLALLKGGKPEEALRVLRDAAQIGPHVPALLCMVGFHTAQALAALGRWDEADETFRGATAAARGLSRSQRAVFEQEIEQFRLELAARFTPPRISNVPTSHESSAALEYSGHLDSQARGNTLQIEVGAAGALAPGTRSVKGLPSSSGALPGCVTGDRGITKANVEPAPGVLETSTRPPCSSTNVLTSQRPRPMPRLPN